MGRDAQGRLTRSSDPSGAVQTIGWDNSDPPQSHVDALGRIQRYGYDTAGSLAAVFDATSISDTHAGHSVIRFTYDIRGNAASVTASPGSALSAQVPTIDPRSITRTNPSRMTTMRMPRLLRNGLNQSCR